MSDIQVYAIVFWLMASWLIAVVAGVPLAMLIGTQFIRAMIRSAQKNGDRVVVDGVWRIYWTKYPFFAWGLLFRYNPVRISLAIIAIVLMIVVKIIRTSVTIKVKDEISGLMFYMADFERGSNEIIENAQKEHMKALARSEQEKATLKKQIDAYALAFRRVMSNIRQANQLQYNLQDIATLASNEEAVLKKRLIGLTQNFNPNVASENNTANSSKQGKQQAAAENKTVKQGDAELEIA